MKVKSESEEAQSCSTLRDPMDCSPPGSSIHGIFQARVLEWVAIALVCLEALIYRYYISVPNGEWPYELHGKKPWTSFDPHA